MKPSVTIGCSVCSAAKRRFCCKFCNWLDLVEKAEQFMLPTNRTAAPDATFLSSVLTSTDHVLGNRRLYYD